MHTPSNFQIQQLNAMEMERRMLAWLFELEAQGVVKHGVHDEWIVLDHAKYEELTGIKVPPNAHP